MVKFLLFLWLAAVCIVDKARSFLHVFLFLDESILDVRPGPLVIIAIYGITHQLVPLLLVLHTQIGSLPINDTLPVRLIVCIVLSYQLLHKLC